MSHNFVENCRQKNKKMFVKTIDNLKSKIYNKTKQKIVDNLFYKIF